MANQRNNNEDSRISNSDTRSGRTDNSRNITENRDATDSVRSSERYKMLRNVDTLLPETPAIEGFHTIWLTTTNPRDSLERRFRLGYSLVNPSEVPGFKVDTQKHDGDLTNDRIIINEMVLAKIPMDLWKGDVLMMHHEKPKELIDNLRNGLNITQDGRGNKIGYTGGEFNNGVADGFAGLKVNNATDLRGII